MTWWIWIFLGLLLLMVELTAFGDFYIIFFGLGALITGLLVALEIGGPLWVQWLLFSIISLAAVLLLRRTLLRTIQSKTQDSAEDKLVRKRAVVIEEIAAGRMGKVETRGTSWNALNVGTNTLSVGDHCCVERVEGVTLHVRAE